MRSERLATLAAGRENTEGDGMQINRVHIVGKNEAVKRLIQYEQDGEGLVNVSKLWAGIAVIVCSAFVLWLGWQLGNLISNIGRMP
jgi:hypothetical protein